MATFELNNNFSTNDDIHVEKADFAGASLDSRKLRDECIIAFKVYDSCRQQDCITPTEIGPARAAECICIGGEQINEGDVILPPNTAATVSIDRLKIKRIIIVDKEPSPFRTGYWNIELKYVFEYRLIFREADCTPIGCVRANSIYNKKITLFGSIGSDLVISTDMFRSYCGDTSMVDADPFIMVEAKAISLSADLKYQRMRTVGSEDLSPAPNSVDVTIGLFSIVKLFRIVHLSVESKGFCIPKECENVNPLNPCDFFEDLEFPMDIFAPPARQDDVSKTSEKTSLDDRNCGCDD